MLRDRNILIVDDDRQIVDLIMALFERERARLCVAGSGAEMRSILEAETVDLILLDVGLPDADGFELLKEIRRTSRVPILMLTGMDTPMDRVLGLEYGADDYICKPFEPRELVARVRSILRRIHVFDGVGGGEAPEANGQVLCFGSWRLDLTQRTLSHETGGEVSLTSGEYALLRCLAEAPNMPLSRDHLLDVTRSRTWSPFDRSIDVLIGRLRKKIEESPERPRLIKTVRGVGYVLASTVSREPASP